MDDTKRATLLFHVGLTVENLDRSLAFYRDVVGMEVQGCFELESEGFRSLTHNPSAHIRYSYLTCGAFTLQLIEYIAGSDRALDLSHNRAGSPHLSFFVRDIEGKYEELKLRGDVKITSRLEQVSQRSLSFYVEDPDGVPVEFVRERTGT